jgi:hypothetical protein
MIKGIIKLIHELRIAFLLLIVLGFFTVIGVNPVSVGIFVGAKMGSAVGMSTSVPENPFNKLALELKEKESKLTQKEINLVAREKAISETTISRQNKIIIALAFGIVILFFLVITNYYLDYQRRKTEIRNK